MVGELTMESRRFTEEADILKQEISSFLCYYKDSVIPALQAEEKSLKKTLEEGDPFFQLDIDNIVFYVLFFVLTLLFKSIAYFAYVLFLFILF